VHPTRAVLFCSFHFLYMLVSPVKHFSYITQVTGTTKSVYKSCSRAKDSKTGPRTAASSALQIAFTIQAHNLLACPSLKDPAYCCQPWVYVPSVLLSFQSADWLQADVTCVTCERRRDRSSDSLEFGYIATRRLSGTRGCPFINRVRLFSTAVLR
jgi:hypothetical protein